MRWAYRIGRLAGTDIKVHVTFPLVVAWWSYSGYVEGGQQAAIWNGGRSGFDAVLRTRAHSPKKGGGGLSWVKE